MMLSSLFDMEEVGNEILVTAGGNEVEHIKDEALLKSLCALWEELGIQDIEAIKT
jgi:hypothetical protein